MFECLLNYFEFLAFSLLSFPHQPLKDLKTAQKTLEAVERDHIIRMLEQTQWKVIGKNSAAEIHGLNRSTLRARMRKFYIRKP